jgi:hypothetical protein
LEAGRKQVSALSDQVNALEDRVIVLDSEVEAQKSIAARFQGSLNATRALLEETIREVFKVLKCTILGLNGFLEHRKQLNLHSAKFHEQQRAINVSKVNP